MNLSRKILTNSFSTKNKLCRLFPHIIPVYTQRCDSIVYYLICWSIIICYQTEIPSALHSLFSASLYYIYNICLPDYNIHSSRFYVVDIFYAGHLRNKMNLQADEILFCGISSASLSAATMLRKRHHRNSDIYKNSFLSRICRNPTITDAKELSY